MTEDNNKNRIVFDLLDNNENLITKYYKLSILIFLAIVIAHILFSAVYIIKYPPINNHQVLQFVTFNITILIIEVFLSRIAFMLGSRAGQLKDIRLCLAIAKLGLSAETLKEISTIIMLLRRNEDKLKVLDIEKITQNMPKKT